MSAADVVLFSLSFLACALLAAWIRSVARERDRFPRQVPARVRDPELTRLSGSLDSALARIEALENRNQDLERRNETLTRLVHSRGAVAPVVSDEAAPGGSGPAEGAASGGSVAQGSVAGASVDGPGRRAAAAAPVSDEDLGSTEEQEEVSPSQWRSAMDRLGPVWPSGGRSVDAVPRSASSAAGGARPPGAPAEPGTSSGSSPSGSAPSGSASPGSAPWGSEPGSSGASGSGTTGAGVVAPGAEGEQGAPTSPWSTLSSAALTASVRRAAPLDDLFPPAGAVGVPSPATDAPRNGTAREPGGPAVP